MQTVKSSDWLVSENKQGRKKYWQIRIVRDGETYYTETSWYQLTKTGKESGRQTSAPFEAKPTNVGRANERDSKAQAEFEYDAIIKKQRDKGYALEGETVVRFVAPMLAHKYKDHSHKVTFPAYVQPKLDGQRMNFDGSIAWSRGNKQILPQVIEHLSIDAGGRILDGELMLPGNVKLQESMSAIKRYQPGKSDKLEYHVYDIVDETLTFEERYEIIKSFDFTGTNFRRVQTHRVNSVDELMKWHKQFIAEGYEGTMVRSATAKYEIGKRSYSLLKLKDFQDMEFKIIDVLEGSGSSKGLAIFKCITDDGKEFDSTPEATHEQRKEWFINRKKLIGKWATVKFQDWTEDGKPTFNNTIAIREDGDF